jgi:hypothetical protein
VPGADPNVFYSSVFPANDYWARETRCRRDFPAKPVSGMDFDRLGNCDGLGVCRGAVWLGTTGSGASGRAVLQPMRNVRLSRCTFLFGVRADRLIHF